jgi:hypothetical protein
MVRAPILARSGQHGPAESLAREAIDLTLQTEAPALQADAMAELAEVLAAAGRHGESRGAMDEALARYGSKGNLAAADRWRARQAREFTVGA